MCLNPKKAVYVTFLNETTGELTSKVLFDLKDTDIKKAYSKENITIPCGNCFECCQEYSKEWSFRIMNECSLYTDNCFITLTYKNNPIDLQPRDLQLFIKRLRKKISPKKIRYFACGEYGSKKGRPHYHLIIFGWRPNDLVEFFEDKGSIIYKSKMVEDIWQNGFISVGDVSQESAKYCAKYMQKMLQKSSSFKVPPFVRMSLKPGIGTNWFLNNLKCLNTDKIYSNGFYIKIPRYYLKKAEEYGFSIQKLKELRKLKAKLNEKSEEQLEIKRYNLKKKFNIY